jgi:hypothetical protein
LSATAIPLGFDWNVYTDGASDAPGAGVNPGRAVGGAGATAGVPHCDDGGVVGASTAARGPAPHPGKPHARSAAVTMRSGERAGIGRPMSG